MFLVGIRHAREGVLRQVLARGKAEVKKVRKFFVAYRNNSLFEKYVSELLKGLDVVGVFVIPAGAKEEEFHQTGVAAAMEARGREAHTFLSDGTCHMMNYSATTGYSWWDKKIFSHCLYLENLFREQVEQAFPENTSNLNLIWFARQVVGGRPIERIVVVKSKIDDHRFAGAEVSGYGQKMGDEVRAYWVKDMLVGAFQSISIKIVETLDEALEYGSNPKALIVADRHCGIQDKFREGAGAYDDLANWPYAAMLYLLPFETTACNLMSRPDFEFNFDLEAMRRKLLGE